MRNVCLFSVMVNNSIDIKIQNNFRNPLKIDATHTLRNAVLVYYILTFNQNSGYSNLT
jgi:hypothetical protein